MPGITRQDTYALIEPEVRGEIIQGAIKQSAVLSTFRRLNDMSTKQTKMRVLDALPIAYWVNNDNQNGRKNITRMAWDNKYITAAEIAVIVPIKEDILDDSDIDIWAQVRPRIEEAFGKTIDEAVILGINKPNEFRADLLTSILNAGATVDQTGTLYSAINDAMVKIEESGYTPNAVLGGPEIKGKFRMMLDNTGQPVKGTEIDSIARKTIDNGTWDKKLSQMIVGDFSQAVYAIRQDITYKVLTEAIIQDPADGSIIYNLAQEDMVALRVVMRLGWEIPNPINALSPDESVRFPFASINPAASASYANSITFTVTDSDETAVQGAKIVCGSIVKTTDSSGTVVLQLPNGTYGYKITKPGHKAKNGSVTVDGDGSVEITDF